MAKMKGLGRGLDALLGGDEPAAARAVSDQQAELKVDLLQPGKYQPRTRMDEAALKELADSVKVQGVMQPILVRPVGGGRYEIIAGERRWRAARMAGLSDVPALVREVPDNAALAMALIENIQREDLNPLEEANGIQRLVTEFNITHDKAAEMVGRSRSAVTNLLRLLALAEPVRETEKLVGRLVTGARSKPPRRITDRDVLRLQEELAQKLGTPVAIKPGAKKGSGKLTIAYNTLDQLDAVLARLMR